jgi:hypothetical protein
MDVAGDTQSLNAPVHFNTLSCAAGIFVYDASSRNSRRHPMHALRGIVPVMAIVHQTFQLL